MIGLVLVTHGRLAEEFRSALEHVVGPQAAIETVALIVDTIVFDGVSVRNDDRSRTWLVALRQALQTAGIPLRDEDVIFSVISAQHASTAGTPGADLPPVAQPANALLAVRSACLDSLGPIVGTA